MRPDPPASSRRPGTSGVSAQDLPRLGEMLSDVRDHRRLPGLAGLRDSRSTRNRAGRRHQRAVRGGTGRSLLRRLDVGGDGRVHLTVAERRDRPICRLERFGDTAGRLAGVTGKVCGEGTELGDVGGESVHVIVGEVARSTERLGPREHRRLDLRRSLGLGLRELGFLKRADLLELGL